MDLRMLLSVLRVGGTPWEPCRVRGLGKKEAPVDCVREMANHSGFSETQWPAIFLLKAQLQLLYLIALPPAASHLFV